MNENLIEQRRHRIHLVLRRPGWEFLLISLTFISVVAFFNTQYDQSVLYFHNSIPKTSENFENEVLVSNASENTSLNDSSVEEIKQELKSEMEFESSLNVMLQPLNILRNFFRNQFRKTVRSMANIENVNSMNVQLLPQTFPLSLYPFYSLLVSFDQFFVSSIGNFFLFNICFALFFIIGLLFETAVFGSLRGSERRLAVEKCMSFSFYHIMFIACIIGLSPLEDLMFWIWWLLVLALFQHFTHLSSERLKFIFSYYSQQRTPTVLFRNSTDFVLIKIFFTIVILKFFLVYMFIKVMIETFFRVGKQETKIPLNVASFLNSFLIHLLLINCHSMLKFFLFITNRWKNYVPNIENRDYYFSSFNSGGIGGSPLSMLNVSGRIYACFLSLELGIIISDMLHYGVMIVWNQHWITLTGLMVLLHLRLLYRDLLVRWRRHKNFFQLRHCIQEMFPLIKSDATDKLYESTEICAICWDELTISRCLPCKHRFHEPCLLSWLLQDLSCPICRRTLLPELRRTALASRYRVRVSPDIVANVNNYNLLNNRASHTTTFQFDGTSYFRWLPSFTIEIARMNVFLPAEPTQSNSQTLASNQNGDRLADSENPQQQNTELTDESQSVTRSNEDNSSSQINTPTSIIFGEEFRQLVELFPNISPSRLNSELWNHAGSLEETIDALLEMGDQLLMEDDGDEEEDDEDEEEDEEDEDDEEVNPIQPEEQNTLEISLPKSGNEDVEQRPTTYEECNETSNSSIICYRSEFFSNQPSERETAFKKLKERMIFDMRQRFIARQSNEMQNIS